MTIPYKLFYRLTDDLCQFLNDPRLETENQLRKTEELVNWPWNANREQTQEWSNICKRFQPHLEKVVAERKANGFYAEERRRVIEENTGAQAPAGK